MPIHLGPITRRRFLSATLSAAWAVGLRRGFAAQSEPGGDRWALLADPHIAADSALMVRKTQMAANLRQVVARLTALEGRLSGVIIDGDCAYLQGEVGDYAQLTGLLRPLREAGNRVHLTLGNHDQRENFDRALGGDATLETAVPGRHVALLPSRQANWFLLDSLEKTNQTPGLLGTAQLEWLTRALDAHPDRPAIVVGHHQVEKGEVKSGLRDGIQLLEILEPRRQVKAYVFGHTHNWSLQRTDAGIHLINLPPVAYVFTEGKPSGWVEARVHEKGMQLRLECLDAKHPEQGTTVDLDWRSA